MTKSNIILILAVIGAIVVAGWILRLTFALLGPILVIALGVFVYLALTSKKGGNR